MEVLLWSIALPGFGQILNGKLFKGLLFIGLELLINVQSNLNQVIISSFKGDISTAIAHAEYQWLMFYPCVYMFAIWDSYKDAGGGKTPYVTIPFVAGAYLGTVGVIYSTDFLGAVWLGISGILTGVAAGLIIKAVLSRRKLE
ncbi:hypothetical protein [Paenibacillus vietnamensis]|uniref:hypothetical protein n=1 Tax=Paenibacillus vietnamensis TaxID=2590547 RepID=UPI001CD132BD|nr:hypothetical protein [Paenibacillus vietnamensis]